jgi:hypothetical protein
MRKHYAILVASVLVLAGSGCGGSKSSRNTPMTRGCTSLTVEDVARVASRTPRKVDLNPSPTEQIRCSTVFFAGPSELIVAVTEQDGGAKALRRLRATKVAQRGAASVRPAPSFGEGAFTAQGRLIIFRRGERVVTLETGYATSGKKVLTLAQLQRLAHIVEPRL